MFKFDPYDQAPKVQPNTPGATTIQVLWPGRYDPIAQSVSTYAQHSIPYDAGNVGIVSVVDFK